MAVMPALCIHKFWSELGLRQKLSVAFACMTLIPLIFTMVITWPTTEQAMTQSVYQRNHILAVGIAADVEQTLMEKVRMLKVAAVNSDIRSMNPSRQLLALRALTAQHPDLLMAITVAPDGRLLMRSDGKTEAGDYSQRDYFQQALTTGDTAYSDVLVSKTTGKLGIMIAQPIKDDDGTLRGMLITGIDLQKLTDQIEQTSIGKTGYTYVVNKEGNVILHPDHSLVENTADVSGLAPVKAAITGRSGWAEYEYNQQKKLAGYSFVPSTRWGLIAQQPLEEALAEVAAIRRTNLLIIAIAAVAAVLIGLAIAGALTRPIADIARAAQRLTEGGTAPNLTVVNRDEIGRLAATFNDMASQIGRRDEALRESGERYRTIFEHCGATLMFIEEDTTVMMVNKKFTEFSGYSREEVEGRLSWTQFVARPDELERMKKYHYLRRQNKDAAPTSYEFQFLTKDGQRKDVIVSVAVIPGTKQSLASVLDFTEHKRLEAVIRDDQQKLRAIVYGSPIPQFVIDRDHKIIFWNRALAEISGVPGDAVIGTNQHWQAFYQEERPCMADLLLDGQIENVSRWYPGTCAQSKLIADAYEATTFLPFLQKWLHFTAALIKDTNGDSIGAVETLEDITERIQMQERVNHLLELQTAILDNAAYMVISTDVTGLITSFNPAAERELGYQAAECIGKLTPAVFHDPAEMAERAQEFSADLGINVSPDFAVFTAHSHRNLPNEYEWTYIREDGSRFPVCLSMTVLHDPQGKTVGFLGIASNITIRKQAEAQLAEAKVFLDKIINSVADPIFVKDRQHRWVLLNDALCGLVGYNRAELLEKSDIDFFPPEEAAVFWAKDEIVFASGAENINEERITDAQGVQRVIVTKKTLYTDDKGHQFLVGIIRDITDIRQAEDALQQAYDELEDKVQLRTQELFAANEELTAMNQQMLAINESLQQAVQELEKEIAERHRAEQQLNQALNHLQKMQQHLIQSEKMAALGSLVAGVAHEVNTPVGVSLMASSHLQLISEDFLLLCQNGVPSRQNMVEYLESLREAAAIITQNLERAGKLIKSFKQVSIDQSHETKRTFYVKKYLDEILLSLHPSIKKAKHHIEVDCPEELAIKGSPGTFAQIISNLIMNSVVHAYKPGETGNIRITVRQEADSTIFIYTDDGKGMNATVLSKIFDPFFTTARGSGGTGLGLFVVYNIVTQQFGGTITCDSTPGQGVTFHICLPTTPAG